MSPQLSLRQRLNEDELGDSSFSNCPRRVSYSNSQLTKAVDMAFSMRQDEGLERPDDLARISNPLGSDRHRLHLRKRKCNFNERHAPDQINTDFLSGIFQDLADVTSDENNGNRSVTYAPFSSDATCGRPKKKSRLPNTLSRCSKSFAKIEISAIRPEDQLIPDGECSSSRTKQTPLDFFSCDDVHPVTSDSTAAKMVDHIFSDSITNINFPDLPSLPATVSASSCSSNNLTQTSVEAPQVLETPSLIHVEGNEHEHKLKDGYGWFVEMDEEKVRERLQAVAAASENCRAIASPEDAALTFAASGPKKAVHLDSEVEWAKAADTVDDVLGGILF